VIGVAVNSERNVRDAIVKGVPLDKLHERQCRSCGTNLFVDEEQLSNASRVFAQLGLPAPPTQFFCSSCARRAEER
jgi:hypothetical protein